MKQLVNDIIEQLGDTRLLDRDKYQFEAHGDKGVLDVEFDILEDDYGTAYVELADVNYYDNESDKFNSLMADVACEMLESYYEQDYKNNK